MKIFISGTLFFIISIFILSCEIDDDTDNLYNNLERKTLNRSIKSVKVFILAGQSNMEGKGVVEPKQSHLDKNKGKGTLRYLVDKAKNS